MGLFKDYVSQTRKPEGFLGKMMLKGMNSGHAKVADWGMDHLNKKCAEAILEIGCGGGRNAGELLKRYPGSHVIAVDYSSLSVEKATEYNRAAIEEGRCACQPPPPSGRYPPESRGKLPPCGRSPMGLR